MLSRVKERVIFFVRRNGYTEKVSDSDSFAEEQAHSEGRSIRSRKSENRQNAHKLMSEANLSLANSSAEEDSSQVRKTSRRGVEGKRRQRAESQERNFFSLAYKRLLRGGHVFDSNACSENRATFLSHAELLLEDGKDASLTPKEVRAQLREAILAVNLGASFNSGDQDALRKFSARCRALQTNCKESTGIPELAGQLSLWSESLADQLDVNGAARTTADVGQVPEYVLPEGELLLKASAASIKKRRIELVRGAVFKVQNLKDVSAADLVVLLRDAQDGADPKYGPRQQLRLCASVMRHRADLGPQERLQVLALAVVAIREHPALSLENQGKAKEMFKQVRRLLVEGSFGKDSEQVAAWLYELGQRVVNYSNEGGKLPVLS